MGNSLSVRAFAVTVGIFSAACVFMVGLINLIVPSYGLTFLWWISSISPGFHADPTIIFVLIGTTYALLEGLLAGGFIAWIYNLVSKILK